MSRVSGDVIRASSGKRYGSTIETLKAPTVTALAVKNVEPLTIIHMYYRGENDICRDYTLKE